MSCEQKQNNLFLCAFSMIYASYFITVSFLHSLGWILRKNRLKHYPVSNRSLVQHQPVCAWHGCAQATMADISLRTSLIYCHVHRLISALVCAGNIQYIGYKWNGTNNHVLTPLCTQPSGNSTGGYMRRRINPLGVSSDYGQGDSCRTYLATDTQTLTFLM